MAYSDGDSILVLDNTQFEAKLGEILAASGLRDEALALCTASFLRSFPQPATARRPSRSYALLTKTWAIKAADLALLEITAPIAIAISAVACEPGSPGAIATLVSSALVSLLIAVNRIRRHSVDLEKLDYELLTVLIASKAGMSDEELLSTIQNHRGRESLTLEDVGASLGRLGSAPKADGEKVALVASDGANHWRASDL